MEYVLGMLVEALAEHWMLATFVGTLIAGENAILVALVFASGQPSLVYGGVLATAYIATLSADLFWYAVGRYGLASISRKASVDDIPASALKRLFDEHLFVSLLLIKFLVGLRVALTFYLSMKKQLTPGRYFLLDSLGIFVFLAVLASVAWWVNTGTSDAFETYQTIVRLMTVLAAMMIATHLTTYAIRRRARRQAMQAAATSVSAREV
ncbi:MAG: hypothetical protein KA731_00565 [Candidatus Moranbacteria bacterium]|nr:hypothetical protein [Candidatus Moranbacteria bacterium]MBP6033911.1 hypothetical protein [Candidatus Moranbacteria bacterium]MBP7695630.1 hypothetical protein [Candidatus Moranbacteria bacterium]